MQRGSGAMLRHIGHNTQEPPRQPGAVWRVWQELRAPLPSNSFIQTVLWGKLLVNSRYYIITGTTACPLRGAMETIEHFMSCCKLRAVIHDTIQKCWGAERLSGGEQVGLAQTFLPKFVGDNLKDPRGLMLWCALQAA